MYDDLPFPAVIVELTSNDGLQSILNSYIAQIEFWEPLYLLESSSTCGFDTWNDPFRPRQVNGNTGPISGGGSGSIIPWSYYDHRIPDAWRREALPGQYAKVGIVDTGVSAYQPQFYGYYPFWRGGAMQRMSHIPSHPSCHDDCAHGTKLASILAAPKDGRSIVGIAWGAQLTVQKFMNGVVLTGELPATWGQACDGIKQAFSDGARVINMAFGASSSDPNLYSTMVLSKCIDEVMKHSRPPILVAAAGTQIAFKTVFPASHHDVVAVSAVSVNPTTSDRYEPFPEPEVVYDKKVEFVSVLGNNPSSPAPLPIVAKVPTAGGYNDDLSAVGGSSSASAHISGIISLAWSKQPWTHPGNLLSDLHKRASVSRIDGLTQVVEGKSTEVGYGILDAYLAVGGTDTLTIDGHRNAPAGTTVNWTASPNGLGPFSYQWRNSSDTVVGTSSTFTFTAPLSQVSFKVQMTDLGETPNKVLHATAVLNPTGVMASQNLWSTKVVENSGAKAFTGDFKVNAGKMMHADCRVAGVAGQLMMRSNGHWVADPSQPNPMVFYNGYWKSWNVTRPGGVAQNDLHVDVRIAHKVASSVAVRVFYTIEQPYGVGGINCFLPDELQYSPNF
jgi:hypothetical protein